jgi:hypothetical protein
VSYLQQTSCVGEIYSSHDFIFLYGSLHSEGNVCKEKPLCQIFKLSMFRLQIAVCGRMGWDCACLAGLVQLRKDPIFNGEVFVFASKLCRLHLEQRCFIPTSIAMGVFAWIFSRNNGVLHWPFPRFVCLHPHACSKGCFPLSLPFSSIMKCKWQ